MAELDLENYYGNMDQVPSETDTSDIWLYQLACIFYGSQGFGAFGDKYEWNNDLRRRFQEAEINRLLISIAASVRRRNEDVFALPDEEKTYRGIGQGQTPDSVGVLIKNIAESDKEYKLTLRDACNKIIHANKLNFDYNEEVPRAGGVLNPVVHCYGVLSGKKWKATLNVPLFIQSAWDHG